MKRLRIPGVHPIEIWDAPCRGGVLQDFRHARGFEGALAEVIGELPHRRGMCRFDHVHLLGGGATEALRDGLMAHGVSCSVAKDPMFAAAREGLARLEGARAPLVVDIGQTSFKMCGAGDGHGHGHGWRVPRDGTLAPLRDSASHAAEAQARSRAHVVETILGAGPCDALLLALPCEIDDAGHLGPCTWAWGDDADWLCDVARRAGAGERLLLINDAELAAAAWLRGADAAERARTTLVLTVGFGVGAALVAAQMK